MGELNNKIEVQACYCFCRYLISQAWGWHKRRHSKYMYWSVGKGEMSRESYENNVTAYLPFLSVSSSSFSFLTVASASITYESHHTDTHSCHFRSGSRVFSPAAFIGKWKKNRTKRNPWLLDSPPTCCIYPATWNFSYSHAYINSTPAPPPQNKQTKKQTKQNITKQIRLIADYNPRDGLYGEVPPKRDTFSSNGPLINIFRTDPPYGRIIIIF